MKKYAVKCFIVFFLFSTIAKILWYMYLATNISCQGKVIKNLKEPVLSDKKMETVFHQSKCLRYFNQNKSNLINQSKTSMPNFQLNLGCIVFFITHTENTSQGYKTTIGKNLMQKTLTYLCPQGGLFF